MSGQPQTATPSATASAISPSTSTSQNQPQPAQQQERQKHASGYIGFIAGVFLGLPKMLLAIHLTLSRCAYRHPRADSKDH